MLLCLTYDVSIGFCYTPVILVTTATNCHYCWRGYPMISLLHVFLGNNYIVIFR